MRLQQVFIPECVSTVLTWMCLAFNVGFNVLLDIVSPVIVIRFATHSTGPNIVDLLEHQVYLCFQFCVFTLKGNGSFGIHNRVDIKNTNRIFK